jgi:4-hydroxy-tetrahydrodipicolinate reductase
MLIDFTTPEATASHAALAAELGRPIVIGTTGLSGEQAAIRRAAERAGRLPPIPASASICCSGWSSRSGPPRAGMGHRDRRDASPRQGRCAIRDGAGARRTAAAARGAVFDEVAQRGRDGITGARKAGAIGFAALRGGDNIGEHHVIFAGLGESLELTHRATNRAIYAKGAVRAARWLVTRPPGLYGMKVVLGL